ncbi:MAG: hypothetical protein Tsb0034_00420 [Ekhidna sp.]
MFTARTRYRFITIMLTFLCLSLSVNGQDIYEKYDIYRNSVRVFLNKFSITFTSGYGATNYAHELSGVYFYQDLGNQFIFSNDIENLGSTFSGYTNWLNNPELGFETSLENPFDVPFAYLPNPVNNPELRNQTFLVDTDTAAVGFKGTSHGIPINLMLHYEYMDFRIGIGYTYERQFVRPLQPTAYQDVIRDYQPNFKSTRYTRIYGMLGYRFYSWWTYDFVAELNVGKINAGPNQFNRAAMSRGLYTNFGISIENNWSEYFRVVIRPSVDFKSYTMNIPDGSSVKHRQPTFFIQAGISINFPDIPRSPMKSDHVQLKHVYTDPVTGKRMEVRGQPIWKRQNPKVGENHRKLWRYKRKNKKKLNPY